MLLSRPPLAANTILLWSQGRGQWPLVKSPAQPEVGITARPPHASPGCLSGLALPHRGQASRSGSEALHRGRCLPYEGRFAHEKHNSKFHNFLLGESIFASPDNFVVSRILSNSWSIPPTFSRWGNHLSSLYRSGGGSERPTPEERRKAGRQGFLRILSAFE